MKNVTIKFKILWLMIATSMLSGCLVLPLKQSDNNRSLYWCAPLLNCASTEAITPIHNIEPFKLAVSYEQAWPIIKDTVSKLKRTTITDEYDGYLYAKSYSATMQFVDYLEVLYITKDNSLNVRSSSLLGIWDMGVNRARTEHLREQLLEQKIIKH